MAITSTGNTILGGTSIHLVLDPKATYLRTNTDPLALSATAFSLSTLGIAAGSVIVMQRTGDYDADGADPGLTDSSTGLLGVFSTSSTLAAATNLNRVTGAISTTYVDGVSTDPALSQNTLNGNLSTDIAQDFSVSNTIDAIIVPITATHLFFSPDDSFFGGPNAAGGNSDPDGDWGVNIYRPMAVGNSGVGTATVTGGTEYRDGVGVGVLAGSNGTLTVQTGAVFNIGGAATPDGADTVDGSLQVGVAGTGAMTISGGSVVDVHATGTYQNVEVGVYTGSSGTLTITGAGSKLVASGSEIETHVGVYGTGVVNVLAGGQLETFGLFTGIRTGSTGTMNISGAGSKVLASNANGSYVDPGYAANYGGFVSFGAQTGSTGNLNITNGGVLEVSNDDGANDLTLRFGRSIGSTAVGIVDGVGSAINMVATDPSNSPYGAPHLEVGRRGDATLTVRNSATVNLTGDRARIIVSSANSNNDESAAAQVAQSELIIQSGAVVTVNHNNGGYATLEIGGEQFGNGAVRLSGNGSAFHSQGAHNEIVVGQRGTGLLTVSSGADITGQRVFIGSNVSGNGTMTMDGVGSTLTLTGAPVFATDQDTAGLWVGNQGSGVLTLTNGATIGITGDSAQIHVGDGWDDTAAVGTLNIQSGSVVTVNQGTNSYWSTTVFAGQHATATGTINITGNGSKLVSIGNKSNINIGDRGTGFLNVTAGADIEGKVLEFGTAEGSNGTGIFDGLGTTVTLAGPTVYDANNRQAQLTIGSTGNGTLTVRNSATVSVTGDRAEINVGTNWENVATPGAGILNIQSGAVVSVNHGTASANYGTVVVGNNQYSTGTINLTGTGSQLNSAGNHNEFVIGNQGTGTFNITAAATATGQRMFVGHDETGVGTVTVDGAGSALNLSGPTVYDAGTQNPGLWVGNRGNGTMTVSNNGAVNISGARAHLFVGDAYAAAGPGHTGVLNIQSGADVTVTNTDLVEEHGNINIGTQVHGHGTVNVTGIGSTLVAAGSSPFINVGNQGTGILNILAGGLVKSWGMSVGQQNGSNGDLNIDGLGSKLLLSNDTHSGAFNANTYGGFLNIGQSDGSYGRADISNGGVLEIRNTLAAQHSPSLSVGGDLGSTGVLNISGATSAINLSKSGAAGPNNYGPFLQVGGRGGDGTMTVSAGAQVNLTGEAVFMRVSRGNNDGDVGAPARVELSELFVQSGADINLTATNGSYYGATLQVGSRTNANGRVVIDGNGSSINIVGNNAGNTSSNTASMRVANNGHGELLIQNGGDLVIDGGDDKRPYLTIGESENSLGTATVTGSGSTVTLSTTNSSADGGGLLAIGRFGGSNGTLSVLNGAVVTNDLGSTNSVTLVGESGVNGGATGTLVVDGGGNATTLLDAGALLVIGAGWNGTNSSLASVGFNNGGTGTANVSNAAIIRADMTAVGTGGTISGNGTFDGAMTVDGGTISPGNSPGRLTVTGTLNAINATLAMEVNGLTAATQYDQLKVNGAVTLGNIQLDLATGPAFNFLNGNSLVLIDGATTLATNLASITVNLTGEPTTLSYALGDTGADLVFEALNSGTGAAIAKMGPISTIGANASLDVSTGLGTGTGGRFDSVRFVNATSLQGTLGADTLSLLGATGGKLEGLAGVDNLTGTSAADILDGGAGADIMTGGDGNDEYTVDDAGDNIIEAAGAAAGTLDFIFSSVSFTNKANVERVFLTGANAINATGLNSQADYLIGNSGANTLTGLNGNDILDGKVGADTMIGGVNNDTYIVDNVGDVVTELTGASAGTMDIINASISFTNFANVERLNLTGSSNINATGLSTQADMLVGNNGINTLSGLGGNDNLNGGAGADTMIGGDGNDIFQVDNIGDVVTELAGAPAGIDSIYTTVSYTNAANVERVYLVGTAALNATGLDSQNDQLFGNTGVNILTGMAGNDTLDGEAGADTMIGGDGNDSYYVDNAGDTVTEAAGATAGTNDTVYTTISFANVANIERINLSGVGSINATGFGTQNEVFFGNNGANVIDGGAGNDTIIAGLGNDTLTGGTGNDTFRFDKNLNALTNKDTITDYNVANDTIQLDNAIFAQLFSTLGNPTSTGTMHSSLFGFAATIDADDRIVYNAATGELSYDINGSVGGGSTVFAQLSAGLGLTNLDFVII